MSLANPILLTGASGSVTGVYANLDTEGAGDSDDGAGSDGIGAGAPDMSSWYEWVCPATGYYVFDTRVTNVTVIHTSLAVYLLTGADAPPTLADLTPVTYVASGREPVAYGYEVGALAAFGATAGATYYINVTSRFGELGQFGLEWMPFAFLTLGACGTCTPAATGLCKIGSAAMGDLTASVDDLGGFTGSDSTDGSVSFGSLASGWYIAVYCGGAFFSNVDGFWLLGDTAPYGPCLLYSLGSSAYVGVYRGTGAFPYSSETITFAAGNIVNGGDGFYICTTGYTVPPGTADNPPDSNANFAAYANFIGFGGTGSSTGNTQQACEVANACRNQGFCHSGGNIIFTWLQDNATTELTNGTPNPTLAVFLFSPSAQLTLAIASISNSGASGGGYNYSVTVSIKNTNQRFASGPFSLKLNNADDVSSSSGTVNISNLAANGTTTATFTFYSASFNSLTGQFQFINCQGANDGTAITLLLAQAVVSLGAGGQTKCVGGCTNLCTYITTTVVNNAGVVPVSALTYAVSATNALFAPVIFEPGGVSAPTAAICAETFASGGLSGASGVIAPGTTIYMFFGIQRNGSGAPTSQVLTIATSAGSVTFPNFTHSLSLL